MASDARKKSEKKPNQLLSFDNNDEELSSNNDLSAESNEFVVKKSNHSLKRVKKLKRITRKEQNNTNFEPNVNNGTDVDSNKNDVEVNVYTPNDHKPSERPNDKVFSIRCQRQFIRENILSEDGQKGLLNSKYDGDDEEKEKLDQDYSDEGDILGYSEKQEQNKLIEAKKGLPTNGNASDNEDEELREWENQQILKGTNNFKQLAPSENDNREQNFAKLAQNKLNADAPKTVRSHIDKLMQLRQKVSLDLVKANTTIKDLKKAIGSFTSSNLEENELEKMNYSTEGDEFMFLQNLRHEIITLDQSFTKCKKYFSKLEKFLVQSATSRHSMKARSAIDIFKAIDQAKTQSVQDYLMDLKNIKSQLDNGIKEDIELLIKIVNENFSMSLDALLSKFEQWKLIYSETYTRSYAALCLAPLVNFYAKYEILTMCNFYSIKNFSYMQWSKQIDKFTESTKELSFPQDIIDKFELYESKIKPYIFENAYSEYIQNYIASGIEILDFTQMQSFSKSCKDLSQLFGDSNKSAQNNFNETIVQSLYEKLKEECIESHNKLVHIKNLSQDQISILIEINCVKIKNILLFDAILCDKKVDYLIGMVILKECIIPSLSLFASSFKILNYCQKILKIIPEKLLVHGQKSFRQFKVFFDDMLRYCSENDKIDSQYKAVKERIKDIRDKYQV